MSSSRTLGVLLAGAAGRGGLDHQGQICTKGDAAVCTLRQLSCSVCALQEAGRMCGAAPNLEEMFMTCLFIRNWLTCPKKGDAPNIAIVLQASRLAHSSLSLSVRHTLMSVECCHCKSQSLSSCTPTAGEGSDESIGTADLRRYALCSA